jgi:alpha-mannosidase
LQCESRQQTRSSPLPAEIRLKTVVTLTAHHEEFILDESCTKFCEGLCRFPASVMRDAANRAMSDPSIVWRIGAEDPSPLAFNPQLLIDGKDIPPFVIGASDYSAAWPQVQPGPLNQATGFRDISVTIQFEIEDDPQDDYELVLDLIQENGPCPELEILINGIAGGVLLESDRPDRSKIYGLGPVTGHVLRRLDLPPGSIVRGTNELTITTTAWERPGPGELVEQMLPLGLWFGSGIAWRGLTLRRSTTTPVPAVRVVPLPLYVDDSSDGLRELVDIVVTVGRVCSHASVELRVGDFHVSSSDRRSTGEFGDFVFRVAVPEKQAPMDAEIVATGEGWTQTEEFTFHPARKWELQLIPHSHIDLGYSDYPGKSIEVNSRSLERTLDILENTPDFRLSVDGTYILDDFAATRTPETVDAIAAAMASGSIHVNSNYFNMLTGISGLEDLYRAYYPSAAFAREHALEVGPANITDVPSYTSSLPSILAAAGIKDFMGIINHYHGGNDDSDVMRMMSPLRWRGPDGAEVLAAFSDCYTQLRYIAADPPTVAGMATSFTRYLDHYDPADYLPHTLPVMGTHADNEDLGSGYADVVDRWNAKYAYPRLRFSTIAEYFDSVRPLYDRLPVIEGDGGSYWEDAAGTQGLQWARTRAVQRLLPAVEGLTALVAGRSPRRRPPVVALDEAWRCILVGDEHTWGSGFSVSQPDSDPAR